MTARSRWVLAATTVAGGLVLLGRARGWTDDPESTVQLARAVGAVLAMGVAGSLDHAGSEVPDAAPRPRWRRHASALMPAVGALTLAWAVLVGLCLPGLRPGVVLGTGLETAILALAAVTGAAMSRDRSGQPASDAATGAVAGATLVFLAAPMLPSQMALVTSAEEPGWGAAHLRWAALGGLLVLVIASLWSDPGRRHPRVGGRGLNPSR